MKIREFFLVWWRFFFCFNLVFFLKILQVGMKTIKYYYYVSHIKLKQIQKKIIKLKT